MQMTPVGRAKGIVKGMGPSNASLLELRGAEKIIDDLLADAGGAQAIDVFGGQVIDCLGLAEMAQCIVRGNAFLGKVFDLGQLGLSPAFDLLKNGLIDAP